MQPHCRVVLIVARRSRGRSPRTGSRSLCGNGVVDPGEDCENGTACCGVTCIWAPAGTTCTSDGYVVSQTNQSRYKAAGQ